MQDPRRACAILAQLREAGITISIDDFGTGHSSLQSLSQLPVDVLKIDRTFVRDIATNDRHRTLVQTTITLAKSFGMTTIAEGVETRLQAEILKRLGCDAIQGYYIARPVSAREFGDWISAWRPAVKCVPPY
jgi:EAL domain-containing protein (putative c-di-GMP-specific phosphodiesterase class I)